MFAPDEVTSVDSTTDAVGSRLLVCGESRLGGAAMDDPVAWACGFTRRYNQADAPIWEQAFRCAIAVRAYGGLPRPLPRRVAIR